MAVVSQRIFDELLKKEAIAEDGKSTIPVRCDGVKYPEGEVFTVAKAEEPVKESVKEPAKEVVTKKPAKEVKPDGNATNPVA